MGAIKIAAHSWKLLTTWTNFQSSFLQSHYVTERFNKHFTAKTALVPLMNCLHHCSSREFGESEVPLVGSCRITIIHGLTIHCNLANTEFSVFITRRMQTQILMFPEVWSKRNFGKKPHPTSQTLSLHRTDVGWLMTTHHHHRKPQIH